MEKINIYKNTPNQVVSVVINSQAFTLSVYLRQGKFYCDLSFKKKNIISGSPVFNNQAINPYNNNSGFLGYIYFINSAGDDISLENLGTTTNVFYSESKI